MPTISRRLASEGTADPSDLRSLSLPGASPGAPTGVWFAGNSRPVRLKPEQPWECKSPRADQFWNVNRTSEPGLGANECVPPGKWCFAIREANVSFEETDLQDLRSPLHGIPPAFAGGHHCARSSKRAGGYAELGVTAVVPSDG